MGQQQPTLGNAFPSRTPARWLSGSTERKSTISQSGATTALQPMSGGQNHKGIKGLNIFLWAGCRDELSKGTRLGIFGLLSDTGDHPGGGTHPGGDFAALMSTELGLVGNRVVGWWCLHPSQAGWGFAGWSSAP